MNGAKRVQVALFAVERPGDAERRAENARVRSEFAVRREHGLRARHAAKLVRLAESWEVPTVGSPTIGCPTDRISTMGDEGTSPAPVAGHVKAVLVHEAARSIRRSVEVRKSLAARDLQPWLATVDSEWPGLVDTERLRLAGILRRHLAAATVRSP